MGELRIVECRGDAPERGRAHGEQLRNEIREFYSVWLEHACSTSGTTEQDLVSYAYAHLPASRDYAPELIEEIEGIAAGADIAFASAFLMNCFDEVACHGPRVIKTGLHGCTAFAATGQATADGRTYVGQGWDMPPICPACLLRVGGKNQPAALVVSHPGLVGGTGINEHGVAIVWNTLKATDVTVGVPALLVARKALQATELAELVGLVLGSVRANGMNFIAADPTAAIDIELSASRYHTTYCDPILSHANHFEAPSLEQFESDIPLNAPDTLLRSGRMRALLEQHRGSIDRGVLESILADHSAGPGSICRHNARGFSTVVSLIYDPSAREMWAADGNPCEEPFSLYSLKNA